MPVELLPERISPKLVLQAQESWRRNPEFFSQQLFGSQLWSKQVEVFNAVRDYKKVAAKSGNTVGKSRIAAEIVLWFLLSYYPSKVVITAPSWFQVETILWKEIAGLYHKSTVPIGAELLNTELKFNEEWFAVGLSTDDINRFQGFHSPYLLVIIDEALGVAPAIWEAIEGLHPYRVLAIGNPLDASGNFYDCFQSSLWHKLTISCFDCIDWQKANGPIPGLVTQEWVNERIEEWGAKSALVQARVLGEFPTESPDTLISRKWLEEARKRVIEEDNEQDSVKITAVDVATKHGINETVFTDRYGHTIKSITAYKNIPITRTGELIQEKYNSFQSNIVIDEDGVGEGLGDILADKHLAYNGFHGGYGQAAIDETRFRNLRSQFYWLVAKKFEKDLYSLNQIGDVEYEILKNQLCSIKVKAPDMRGRIQIETKEDMMARGLKSPDYADSFMMSEYAFFCGNFAEIKGYRYR